MKSSLLPAAVIGTLCLSYLLTGNKVWLLFLSLIAAVWLLRVAAHFNPHVRTLFDPVGPRTDTRYMTRVELLRSSVTFACLGFATLAVLFLAALSLSNDGPDHLDPLLGGFFFATFILTAMWFLGGVYLLIRGLFRRRDYDPAEVYRRDTEGTGDNSDEHGDEDNDPARPTTPGV